MSVDGCECVGLWVGCVGVSGGWVGGWVGCKCVGWVLSEWVCECVGV